MEGRGIVAHDLVGVVSGAEIFDLHVDNPGIGGFRFPFPLDSRQIVFDLVVVKLSDDVSVGINCGVQFR